MIAKRIPEESQRRGKKSDVAAAYGLTIAELSNAMQDFLQGEGYNDYGNEAVDLHEWLTMSHTNPKPDKTPWQKGDDWNI